MTDRKTYIGSSDAKSIISGDWDNLYRRKMGLEPEPDFSDNFPVQLGLQTEDFHLDWTIAALCAEQNTSYNWSKFQKDGQQHWATFRPEGTFHAPRLGSHPDALIQHPSGEFFPVEAKITGRFRNVDEAADFYMPQLQHHMICWDVEQILLSVVCGTNEPERVWVGYSHEWASHYIERADAFWGHLKSEMPPAPLMTDTKRPTTVPKAVADSVPLNGMRKMELTVLNSAAVLIDTFLETKQAVERHEKAKKDLKALVPPDVKEAYSNRLTMKRDARGAIRFTIHDTEQAA